MEERQPNVVFLYIVLAGTVYTMHASQSCEHRDDILLVELLQPRVVLMALTGTTPMVIIFWKDCENKQT